MDVHKTWPELKSHFQEAYELQLQSGGFNGNNPCHGAANAFIDGDDSIDEINESITNIHRLPGRHHFCSKRCHFSAGSLSVCIVCTVDVGD